MRVTMNDVAKDLNVSPSTVSRALRNDQRISSTTRERVQEAVARLGFRVDPGAANLVAHRWNRTKHTGTITVGLIQRNDSVEAKRDFPFFEAAAAELGIRFDVMTITSLQDLQRLPRIMQARGLHAGLLEFVLREEEIEPVRELSSLISLVFSNHRQSVEIGPSVVRDAYHRVMDALHEMVARGYRRIGLCLPVSQSGVNEMGDQMQAAFLWARKQLGTKGELSLLTYHKEGLMELRSFIQGRKLQAILDFEGVACSTCRKLGLRIPEDIAYASMATRETEIAGIIDTRQKVIQGSLKLLHMMMRTGQMGSDLAMFRQEIRGEWQDAPTLPDLRS